MCLIDGRGARRGVLPGRVVAAEVKAGPHSIDCGSSPRGCPVHLLAGVKSVCD